MQAWDLARPLANYPGNPSTRIVNGTVFTFHPRRT